MLPVALMNQGDEQVFHVFIFSPDETRCKDKKQQKTNNSGCDGRSLAPHVLRVASLGHQFLDVICGLGARHAALLLGDLIEGRLHVFRHVPCVTGRQIMPHFNAKAV